MRYGIFSDVHSNLEGFLEVLEAYKKESIDTYLSLGDIVGYGANPKECIQKAKSLAIDSVAGNHDWASVDLFPVTYFNTYAKDAIAWTKKQLDDSDSHYLESLKLVYRNEDLTLVHGTLDNPSDFNYLLDRDIARESLLLLETDICFIGHSHIAGIFIQDKSGAIEYMQENSVILKKGKKYIVNVGSVGQPRDNNPKASYCVYDTEQREVQIKRVAYDTETARKKIINAGLPKFLGDRLLMGR